MRSLPLLLTAVILVAYRPVPVTADRQQEPILAMIDTLVSNTAQDFQKQNPGVTHFRKVRGAYVKPGNYHDGDKQYRLCGEFQAADTNDWVPFVTLKTYGYELWMGGQAVAMCKHRSLKWEGGDLSSLLETRRAALK